MNTFSIQKIVEARKKRVGRGHGSGKVKTSGRGTKGQNARGHMPLGFEGGQVSLIKRLPLLRGKDKNRSQKHKAFPVSLDALSLLPKGTKVSLETLAKYHIIDEGVTRVKLLGKEKLTQALTVLIPCSESARESVKKAGGSVEA